MIDRNHDLALTRQAKLLTLSRSSLYYEPRPVPEADLAIMRRIDERHFAPRLAVQAIRFISRKQTELSASLQRSLATPARWPGKCGLCVLR